MPVLHAVVPHFEEARTLPEILARTASAPLPHGWRRAIVVVDDRSGDAAWEVARASIAEVARHGVAASLLRHERNLGKGAAIRTGLASLAAAAPEDAVILQDADLEYDPRDHAALLDRLDLRHRAVYGTRWWGEGAPALGPIQRFGNWLLTRASNRMTGQALTDMECGLKLIAMPAVRAILPELDEDGFGIEPQITAALSRHGIRIAEVPVRYAPRSVAEGKKIRWRDGFSALAVIRRERRRPTARGAGE